MFDLATEKGALEFCDAAREMMEMNFALNSRFEMNGYSFGAYVFRTHEVIAPGSMPPSSRPRTIADVAAAWKTGEALPEPRAELIQLPRWVAAVVPDDKQTKFFRHLLRQISETSRAIGVAVMGEAWFLETPAVPGQTAQDVREALPANLGDAPGRQEALFLRLEHQGIGQRFWRASIKRNPDGLGPWELITKYEQTAGSLVDLIPRAT